MQTYYRRALILMLSIGLLFTACSSIDRKITGVKEGDSLVEVIQLLGEPNKVWGYGYRGEISFIYEGQKTYSVVFTGGPLFSVLFVREGRFGGEDSDFRDELTFQVQGKRIELRRGDKADIVIDGDEVRLSTEYYYQSNH